MNVTSCTLCKKNVPLKEKEQHLIDHIDEAQQFESEWYQAGLDAKALYKKLYKRDA